MSAFFQNKARNAFATDYGVVGDGVADDTVALQAADAANVGKILIIPNGVYKVTAKITVQAHWVGSGTYDRTDLTKGAVFRITDTVNEALSLKSGGTIEGCIFYHPSQSTGATPVVYPPTIKFYSNVAGSITPVNVKVANNFFVNSYIAIDTGGVPASSLGCLSEISGNRICAISVGIKCLYSATENHFVNNMFSYAHWYASIGQLVRPVISSTATAIQISDSGGTKIAGNTIFGMGTGLSIELTGYETTVTGNTFDGCLDDIKLDNATTFGELTISGNLFLAKDVNDAANVSCRCIGGLWSSGGGRTGLLTVTGNTFSASNGHHINLNCTVGTSAIRSAIGGNTFLSAGRNDTVNPHYSIYINDTVSFSLDAAITGNIFEDQINAGSSKMVGIRLVGRNFTVVGNSFRAVDYCIDVSGLSSSSHTTVIGNVGYSTRTSDLLFPTTQGVVMVSNNRWSETTSASYTVASAATVTLPVTDGQMITITGTTGITSITASWPGRVVYLKFNGSLTVTDGSNLLLAGNFVATVDDILTLICDGTNWREIARAAN